MTTEYEWKIFRRTISDDWELLTDVDTILSISRFRKELAVKAGTLIGGITYKFRLESWVRGSGSRGYSEYEKEVNSPAKGGRCQIRSRHTESPELGYAFQPDFLITAFGWQDDTKLVYSVTAQVDSDQPEITVPADATLEVGQEYQSPPLTLPPGLEANDFWIHVFVKITDEDGASITVALRVQVRKKKILKRKLEILCCKVSFSVTFGQVFYNKYQIIKFTKNKKNIHKIHSKVYTLKLSWRR